MLCLVVLTGTLCVGCDKPVSTAGGEKGSQPGGGPGRGDGGNRSQSTGPRGDKPQAKKDDEKTITRLKDLGAKLQTREDGSIQTVNFAQNKKIKDDDLKQLAGLPKLEVLYLTDSGITDKGLEHLKGLTELRELYLGGTKVTDDGMAHIESLKLRSLVLFKTQVSDAKVAALQRRFGPAASVVK
jgi:hypothetical protein